MKLLFLLVILIFFCFMGVVVARGDTASWYSVESCKREGTSGICADGSILNDEEKTCASWDYPFGTKLQVVNISNGKSVYCMVTDRGPNRKLYRQGRTIDLSKRAFREIADLKQGVIEIEVEVIK